MDRPPPLFDTSLARQRMRRTTAEGGFLQAHVAGLTAERLNEVNRSFKSACILGPWAELWADVLGQETDISISHVGPVEEVLNLSPGAHDLVIHALNLHGVNDPVGQLVQARLGLQPDGLLLASLFGGETLSDLRVAFAGAEAEVLGGITPRIAPMGEIRAVGALLQRAGFALPVADSLTVPVSYADPLALMRDLRVMGESNTLAARHRSPMPRQLLAEVAARYPKDPDGRITAIFEVVFLTGWAPAASQPQPLRPGSATHRLADVLNAEELNAGDKTGR